MTDAGMTQRRLILFIGAYLAATSLMAWFAFVVGHNQGLQAAPAAAAAEYRPLAYVDVSENVWSCDQFRGFPGLRANHRERVCGPGGDFAEAAPARHSRRFGPLQQAMVMRIAGGGPSSLAKQANLQVPGALGRPHGDPAALFDPSSGVTNGGIVASASGASWSAPGGGRFAGQPLTLLAGPNDNGEPPPEEPPPPEITPIPVPGALPLMATALATFAAAARRRRRRRAP